ncbi:carbonic anhydrase [Flavilitoribacter nigricans]|uniref:Carbonic anhydrase n=1 Tax=Flavilitoribacter nigricans (strain ATCC 23147 / DSM 23189 / NBRC 102662 / NCIMB 1420 / SS-2) TaxID=1122177 RepID=A0A2D0NHH0_FLAN2|nr:carbonic anhydrase [Flavilitoribacter nigricans]PHN07619.1 carbonic anhydrase [Flavilitoribacter nigricans DSM 23189 = NBRC 102662]
MEKVIAQFLQHNREWAAEKQHKHPRYFDKLTAGQKPAALLLGCSDSRVSPAVVLGGDLGEIFVHRNIANLVAHSDLNFLSVLQYAVEVLKVDDIIVYGHYGCGGIQAALEDQAIGLIDNWLANIKDVIHRHRAELDAITDEHDRLNRLVELNVLAQVENLKLSSVYRKAVKAGRKIRLHPWVYDFSTGLVTDLSEAGVAHV